MTRWDRDPYLMRVLQAFGNATVLADYLNLSRQAVSSWKQVPSCHIRAISEKTGIHPYRIRPDLYIEGFWNMGKNTADIAEEMRMDEAEVHRLLGAVLWKRRQLQNDLPNFAIPPVSEPPMEGQ